MNASQPHKKLQRSTPNLMTAALAITAMLGASLLVGCIADDGSAGGFVGIVDGSDFSVVSGRAEMNGGELEIVLSDDFGDGCSGSTTLEPIGNRKIILTTADPGEGTHNTNTDAQISIQIKNEGEVFTFRNAQGSFTLQTFEQFEGGLVEGTIDGTNSEGDDLNGDFFVQFCP